MSDIATKLTYLNETKSQLKDMINYGLPTENQITSSTTFRNYVSSIFEAFLESLRDSSTLYTNLPKISGNGTQITLNDTANAPMRITLNPSALSQDATPTPDSPQDIHTISGDNTIKVENKNIAYNVSYTDTLTRYGNMVYASYSVVENQYYAISVDTPNTGLSGYINLRPASYLTRISGNYAVTLDGTRNTWIVQATATANVTNMGLFSRNSETSTTGTGLCSNFMIEPIVSSSGTSSDYVEHQEQTQLISLGDIEYCKIGNYEDRIFKNVVGDTDYDSSRELGKWYIKKNIGKVVLDGTESGWQQYTNSSRYNTFRIRRAAITKNTLKCSHFVCVNTGGLAQQGQCENTTQYYNLNFVPTDSINTSTISDWQTWLSTNNVTIYYQLATPTYTQITGTLETQLENIYKNMLSYKNQTNVSQVNNDLPFEMVASAIQNLS